MRPVARRSRSSHRVHKRASRVRDELRFLRERTGRVRSQLDEKRNRRRTPSSERVAAERRAIDPHCRHGDGGADAKSKRVVARVGGRDVLGRN